jgi:biopolymer transport protein TolR
MSHSESSGRGRSTNVDLNLVPFIDLMSVLITFLLISAVWTQVSMIQLGASFASPKDASVSEYKPPLLEDLVLRLDVVASGFVLKFGSETKPIPKQNNEYDVSTLLTELQKVKKLYPDKPGIKISIADEIMYESVIAAMDTGLKAGFSPELLTGGPN